MPSFILVQSSGSNSVVECDLAKVEVAGSNPVSRSSSSAMMLGVDLMPNSVALRIPIVLAWGIPSLVLWLVLRAAAKRSSISMDRVRDGLIVVLVLLLALYVVFSAMEKDLVAGPLGMNCWGFMAILDWLHRRRRPNQFVLTNLNITGREPVSTPECSNAEQGAVAKW